MERGSEWIKSLKIAIINDDLEKLKQYSTKEIPSFSLEEAKEALALVNQAKEILIKERNQIGKELQALKQAKKYSNTYYNSTNDWQA
jgi:hypothetical protein